MSAVVKCDSCQVTQDSVSGGVVIGGMFTPKGLAGWGTLQIAIAVPYPAPDYLGPAPDEKDFVASVNSSIDLCPKCLRRVLMSTGCMHKIQQEPHGLGGALR